VTSWRAAARSVGFLSADWHRVAHAELDLLLNPGTPIKVVGRRYGLTAEERLGLTVRVERFAWARASSRKRRAGQDRAGRAERSVLPSNANSQEPAPCKASAPVTGKERGT
jgi:hypothetical protein